MNISTKFDVGEIAYLPFLDSTYDVNGRWLGRINVPQSRTITAIVIEQGKFWYAASPVGEVGWDDCQFAEDRIFKTAEEAKASKEYQSELEDARVKNLIKQEG